MSDRLDRVARTEDLAEALARIGEGPLALDTEADSLHHYPEKVCLVQMSFGGVDYIVDPLDERCDLGPLGPPLADPGLRTILHGADYDLRMLDRERRFRIAGLFDTMVAARLVGERRFGLAALLEQRFGVTLNKSLQRADWSRRPLPEAMERYAAMDTRYLEQLAAGLAERLRELGREEWAAEEFARLEAIRWQPPDEGAAARRVKGAAALERRGMSRLQELVRWREGEATRRDRPPFRVLRDEALLALARADPRDADGVAAVLAERRRSESRIRGVLSALERSRARSDDELPEPPSRRRPRPDPAVERRGAELRRIRDEVAHRLGLEPSLLGSRATLDAVAARLECGEDPAAVPDLRSWQWRLLEAAGGAG